MGRREGEECEERGRGGRGGVCKKRKGKEGGRGGVWEEGEGREGRRWKGREVEETEGREECDERERGVEKNHKQIKNKNKKKEVGHK